MKMFLIIGVGMVCLIIDLFDVLGMIRNALRQ